VAGCHQAVCTVFENTPDDGYKEHPKHVECQAIIKKLQAASSWLFIERIIYTYLPFMNNNSVNVNFWFGTVQIEHSTPRDD
jgi:hypothetical protein